MFFNPIQDGGGRGWGWGKKASATSFSPVTSTNVRISLKTFWLLVLTLLTDWCKISSLYLVPVPDYWTWTKTRSRSDYWTWTNCATLHHCRICVTDFREGGVYSGPLILEQPQKSPSWIGLNVLFWVFQCMFYEMEVLWITLWHLKAFG